ncbi:MAG: hypothetical protein OK454_08635 [Thaumarchaeota archaeon]|nr:hypothetical protein [Nitrososphaerota archaeon]
MKCSACSRSGVRKTTRATVLTADGAKGGLVCERCARLGVLVVPAFAPNAVLERKAGAEAKSKREVLKPYVRQIRARIKAASLFVADGGDSGNLETLEGVLHLLTREGEP